MPQKQLWSRDDLIAAFNLYCRIPFGQMHKGNPKVIDLAGALSRTPSAVALKLVNYASLDPLLQARGIRGAAHGSKRDKEIWREFHDDWEALAYESELALARLKKKPIEEIAKFPEGTTRETVVRARVNQTFFRAAVLAAYNSTCCITGLAIPDLLIASHILR